MQSQVTTVITVTQGYALKAVHSRLMSGGAPLDMHIRHAYKGVSRLYSTATPTCSLNTTDESGLCLAGRLFSTACLVMFGTAMHSFSLH